MGVKSNKKQKQNNKNFLPNITQSMTVFSFGLETKQSTTLGHGHLEHLNNSGTQNL